MKQISKAEFIRRVTENPTIFVGISPSGDEIPTVKARLQEHSAAPRYAICLSNQHLIFGVEKPNPKRGFINDSHLYLADVKPHTFIKCYAEDEILMVDTEWHDSYDDSVSHKYLYYKEVK